MLRRTKFEKKVYRTWLMLTHEYAKHLQSSSESISEQNKPIVHLLPSKEILAALEEDIGLMKIKDKLTPDARYPPITHPDQYLIMLYTYLGSKMGATIILKFVESTTVEVPTNYLKLSTKEDDHWNDFKSILADHKWTLSKDQIAEFTHDLWLAIYDHHESSYR